MLEVTVYPLPGNNVEPDIYENIDYVSFVNNETYGPPALVAPARPGESPTAQAQEQVLFINTNLVPLFAIERI